MARIIFIEIELGSFNRAIIFLSTLLELTSYSMCLKLKFGAEFAHFSNHATNFLYFDTNLLDIFSF